MKTRRRLKTKFKVLFFVFFILLCIGIIFLLFNNKDSSNEKDNNKTKKNLLGEKVIDGLYLYNIETGDEIFKIKVIKDSIYYMIDSNDKYEFYKLDIYSNKREKLGEVSSLDNYCNFEDDFIDCYVDNKKIMYDYSFKTIYEGEEKVIIPYKDDYIKYENNTIYFKNKEFRKIEKDLSNKNFYRYDSFDDNIYLYFASIEDDDSCILNVMDNKCENYKYTGIRKYNKGLYFFDKDKIHVLDVKNNKIKDYNNPVEDELLTLSFLDNNHLYYFSDDYLKVYNLENERVSLFDYRLNEDIDEIVLNNDLLFIIGNKKIYVLKNNEISLNEITKDELDNILEKKITDKLEKINNDYGVEVKIRENANIEFKEYNEKMIGEKSYDVINDSLDYTEEVLSLFGHDLFNEFIHDKYKGLKIYLVSQIKSDMDKSGEELRYKDEYVIIIKPDDYKRTLCHEITHALENAASYKGNNIFSKWSNYNPKGFKYKFNYNEYDQPYKYTIDYKKGDVYFIDNYSQTDSMEDRARIFENICMNTTQIINDNPYLLKKAQYEVSEIKKYYPMLENSSIFNNINME